MPDPRDSVPDGYGRMKTAAQSNAWTTVALVLLCASLGTGCAAAFAPRGTAGGLTWVVENLTRAPTSTSEETHWSFTLVIANRSRQAGELFQSAFTLALDGVYLSPEIEDVQLHIPAGGALRLPRTAVFSRERFVNAPPGMTSPVRPHFEGPYISWQFLGRYANRAAIILNIDFVPK